MQGKSYSSEGIVIGIKSFREADKIITVYSSRLGKIRLLAKGVAKPKSRKRGSLDLFNKIKFSWSHGKGFDMMAEVELISEFSGVKKDLKKSAVAYFLAETISRLTADHEPNSDLYLLLEDYLGNLEKSKNTKILRQNFIKEVLVNLGFWPANKALTNPDEMLLQVSERAMHSARVGKKLLS